MSDVFVRQSSPKASPRGSRFSDRQDSTGTLKTTITLGPNPTICGPFYLTKEPPEPNELTGNTNLMAHHGLEHSYTKFCGKKPKEELSAFLPNLPGNIDTPGIQDNSSLRTLIEKPPITGKEIQPLTGAALAGFRLHPGPLPEQYRLMSQLPQKKKKHKRHKESGLTDGQDNTTEQGIKHKNSKKGRRNDEDRKKRKKEKKKKKDKGPQP